MPSNSPAVYRPVKWATGAASTASAANMAHSRRRQTGRLMSSSRPPYTIVKATMPIRTDTSMFSRKRPVTRLMKHASSALMPIESGKSVSTRRRRARRCW
jgi:hypothetical protein